MKHAVLPGDSLIMSASLGTTSEDARPKLSNLNKNHHRNECTVNRFVSFQIYSNIISQAWKPSITSSRILPLLATLLTSFETKLENNRTKHDATICREYLHYLCLKRYFAAKVTAISHVRFGQTTHLKHQADLPSKAMQLDLWPYPRHGNYHGRRKSTFDLVAVCG